MAFSAAAQPPPARSAADPVAAGFDHFYNLEFPEAIAIFRANLTNHPDSADARNHLAQAILYRELYKTGGLESELVTGNNPFVRRARVNPSAEDQREFDTLISDSIAVAQRKLASKPRDAAALYALGVAYGLRSNYLFLVRKSWMDALRDATNARKAHQKILDIDPGDVDARLTQGVHDYLVGSLNFFYRMLGFLAGIRGDKEGGIRTLETVMRNGRRNRMDASIVLAAIYRRERRPKDAIPLVQTLIAAYPRNHLFVLELAQMYADAGEKQRALDTLAAATDRFPNLAPGKLLFTRGNLLFWYGDYDAATADMQKAAAGAHELDLNTAALAWLRLGQLHDIAGRREEAKKAYQESARTAPDSDIAKEAKGYLGRPFRRGTV